MFFAKRPKLNSRDIKIANCVWITGAGKGIGRSLARLFAENSWTVAVSSRTQRGFNQLARRV